LTKAQTSSKTAPRASSKTAPRASSTTAPRASSTTAPRASSTTAPRDQDTKTADRVLSEGAKLFREQGYGLSTTRQLSARLGINKASLYYHVSSKEDLLYKICIESLRRVTEAVKQAIDSTEDPLDKLLAVFHAQLGSVLGDLDLHATMLLELRSLTGQRQIEVQRARDEYEALLVNVIAEAQQAKEIRTDLSAKQVTVGMLSLLNWTIYYYKPDGLLSPDGLAEMLWQLFINGARSA
jgi:TetR/AcrR family transcriptional regulator, cholesterol catabolism regulator